MSLTKDLVRPEILRAHRASWSVYAGSTRLPHQKTMRGLWGYDVTCSCGWDSRTGGAIRRYVEDLLLGHRTDAQFDANVMTFRCPVCQMAPGCRCYHGNQPVGFFHPARIELFMKAEES